MEKETLTIPDFDFFIGGYFASNLWIKAREGLIRLSFNDYPNEPEDLFVELEDYSKFPKDFSFINYIEEIIPNEKEWNSFLEVLKITEKWKKEYLVNICDGTQWELKAYYKYPEGKRKLTKTFGSNEYPDDFTVFGKALAKLINYSKLKNPYKFKFWKG